MHILLNCTTQIIKPIKDFIFLFQFYNVSDYKKASLIAELGFNVKECDPEKNRDRLLMKLNSMILAGSKKYLN